MIQCSRDDFSSPTFPRLVEHTAEHQSLTTDFTKKIEFIVEGMQSSADGFPLFDDMGHHLRCVDLFQGSTGNGGDDRVSSEGRPVIPGFESLGDFFAAEHGADGKSAAKGFGQGQHIGNDSLLPFMGKEFSGSAHSALDFIEDQKRLMAVTEFPEVFEEAGTGRIHPAFALKRFYEHCTGLGPDGLFGFFEIVVGCIAEASRKGAESLLVFWLRSSGHRSQGSAVERSIKTENLAFIFRMFQVSVFSHQFNRRFVCLCSGVAEKDPIRKGSIDQFCGQSDRRFGEKKVAGVPEF